ncbi:alpha/beta hydrolase [Pasteurellaceae bacterium LIM206]|nr:alpha/beta hydrolase [Pasteurellaceae bacterium LIM206]
MQREPFFTQFALTELMPFAQRFPLQYLPGRKGCRIAYRHFTHSAPTDKLVILVNGRAENILKWTEVAFDFYRQGYDVLAFDHRGQGYSQRLVSDHEKSYIDEFRFYMDDMASLINRIQAQHPYQTQHIVSHSMGGLISTYYLARYDHRITSAVLSAPFFGMPLKHPICDQIIIGLMLLFGQGERYVFGKEGYHPANLRQNELSFCKTRMKWMNRINRNHPELHLGGPTFRWVHVCLHAIKGLPKVIPQVETPVLVLYSAQEKIVNNKTLKHLTALFPHAEVEEIVNAKHEILFERDELRNKALERIYGYFATKR